MLNYRKQNGCINCKHVFVRYEYEEQAEYYCALNAPPRPMCGSVAMHEWSGAFGHSSSLATDERIDHQWKAWSKKRKIEAYGICDMWEHGEVTTE